MLTPAPGWAYERNVAPIDMADLAPARAALGGARFEALQRVGESWPDERAGAAGLARDDIA